MGRCGGFRPTCFGNLLQQASAGGAQGRRPRRRGPPPPGRRPASTSTSVQRSVFGQERDVRIPPAWETCSTLLWCRAPSRLSGPVPSCGKPGGRSRTGAFAPPVTPFGSFTQVPLVPVCGCSGQVMPPLRDLRRQGVQQCAQETADLHSSRRLIPAPSCGFSSEGNAAARVGPPGRSLRLPWSRCRPTTSCTLRHPHSHSGRGGELFLQAILGATRNRSWTPWMALKPWRFRPAS